VFAGLNEEQMLSVFENTVARRIYGTTTENGKMRSSKICLSFF
jgi:hypothetical protein